MDVQLHDALLLFQKWIVGKQVRGQVVQGVSLNIDDVSKPDHPLRYTLDVWFRENAPPDSDEPEMKMLKRVFSDIPSHASIMTHNVEELRARLVGLRPCHDEEWILSDEEMPHAG